jgi:hypothetical protein
LRKPLPTVVGAFKGVAISSRFYVGGLEDKKSAVFFFSPPPFFFYFYLLNKNYRKKFKKLKILK